MAITVSGHLLWLVSCLYLTNLIQYPQHSNQGMIVVSKLCCPVCWQLMEILRGDSEDFRVRGRHTTMFPVGLPSWLPIDVLQQMVDRFKKFLLDELVTMVQSSERLASTRRHNRNPSQQSESGLSVASDESPVRRILSII
jgi:hypothetical protein